MAKYSYTAIDQSGKQKTGKIDAADDAEANAKLSGMGLMVSGLTKEASKSKGGGRKGQAKGAAKSGGGGGFHIGKAINQEGLTIFTRQLATLLQAGLPLLRGLEVMIRQEKNPAFKTILTQIADNVRSGNNLSDGLAQHPKIFDRLFVNMVRAGEAGGVLDVVLSRLARFMEKALKTKKKVKSAMIYPSVVITVAVAIVVGLMIGVVPRFQQIFEEMLGGAQLPALTRWVIGFSDFIQNNIIVSIIIVVVLVVAFKFGINTTGGRMLWDRITLRMPKIGGLLQIAAISRFARTFGTLLSSGVPILQALQITKEIIGNSVIESALEKVHDRVRDGEPLAAPLEQQRVFPTMVTSMIDVGEETGELAEMLNRIADNYDEDVDNAVNSLTSIIEPIMIVVLALIVGVIVIALFLPIIGIIQQLSGG
ncbi:type II secretion system F family protein [Rubellicoccus peritrichatus]|uniref:General secretion pathway protein F n=1 Tax=Rubellicoccus peritrichatus TaxID=3080537 RepID=A0AAQ3QUV9_9BACT|nr:type II secretion system F family protein [Puniceicoccus sp. CR14]WOO42841.1 type II secretion system F family protein [Puniceicoccus sp. CR14]